MNLLPYIYYHLKSISKFFQTEIIIQLESITLFSHSSHKKAPSWLTRFRKFCLSEIKNSNGILICERMVIAETRIIKKYCKLNIWHVFENFVVNFGVFCDLSNIKFLIFFNNLSFGDKNSLTDKNDVWIFGFRWAELPKSCQPWRSFFSRWVAKQRYRF